MLAPVTELPDDPDCVVCGVRHTPESTEYIDLGTADGKHVVACVGRCADQLPCPVCGLTVGSPLLSKPGVVHDPSLTSPLARLRALARDVDIEVAELPPELGDDEVAGAVAIRCDDRAGRGVVALADGLDDAAKADVLAFGLAVCAVHDQPRDDPVITVGIRRQRLPPARSGAGHIAWHILRTCGRLTSSATFDVVPLTFADGD
ncbi:MAG: hypothetical protein GEV04_05070 [Actinophytocola sp.]|nr:hypothetical protein [Actinophytocola sp.]